MAYLGLSMASELRSISKTHGEIFGNIKGVETYFDDLLVCANS